MKMPNVTISALVHLHESPQLPFMVSEGRVAAVLVGRSACRNRSVSLPFSGIGLLKRQCKLPQDLLVIHHLTFPVLQDAGKHLIFGGRLVFNVYLMDRAVLAEVVRLNSQTQSCNTYWQTSTALEQ